MKVRSLIIFFRINSILLFQHDGYTRYKGIRCIFDFSTAKKMNVYEGECYEGSKETKIILLNL